MSFLTQPLSIPFLNGPQRVIGGINVNVVVNETTTDELTITKQPVQLGASITDHSYMEPVTFSSTLYREANISQSLPQIYQQFLDLQQSRVPFDIATPKRLYKNMLMSSLGMTVDKNTENILALHLSFQQIIIVNITTAQVPRTRQKNPGTTGATQKAGQQSSVLYDTTNAIKTHFGVG